MSVICNDIFAYIFGKLFGRTPLIHLSPKKTWEGFIGGCIATFTWAFITSAVLSDVKFLVCPQHNFSLAIFENLDCTIPKVF